MIDVRAAVILLGSAGCGAIAGALQLAAGGSWPDSLRAAGAALALAVGVLALVVKDSKSPE